VIYVLHRIADEEVSFHIQADHCVEHNSRDEEHEEAVKGAESWWKSPVNKLDVDYGDAHVDDSVEEACSAEVSQ